MSLDERDYMKRNRRADQYTSYPSRSIGTIKAIGTNKPVKSKKKSWIRRIRDFLVI